MTGSLLARFPKKWVATLTASENRVFWGALACRPPSPRSSWCQY